MARLSATFFALHIKKILLGGEILSPTTLAKSCGCPVRSTLYQNPQKKLVLFRSRAWRSDHYSYRRREFHLANVPVLVDVSVQQVQCLKMDNFSFIVRLELERITQLRANLRVRSDGVAVFMPASDNEAQLELTVYSDENYVLEETISINTHFICNSRRHRYAAKPPLPVPNA